VATQNHDGTWNVSDSGNANSQPVYKRGVTFTWPTNPAPTQQQGALAGLSGYGLPPFPPSRNPAPGVKGAYERSIPPNPQDRLNWIVQAAYALGLPLDANLQLYLQRAYDSLQPINTIPPYNPNHFYAGFGALPQ